MRSVIGRTAQRMTGSIVSNQMKKMIHLRGLRQRAQSRLSGQAPSPDIDAGTSIALNVLYKLASSPDTAEQALALLHEIQVHQIEIDMQADELRSTLAGSEASLDRQIEYHDAMPVACFNIDASTRLLEINQTGAHWLGLDRGALLGQTINAFLTPDGKNALIARMTGLAGGRACTSWETTLLSDSQAPRTVQAALSADPVKGRYILVLMALHSAAPTTSPR